MGKIAKNIANLTDAFALQAKCPEGKRFIVWQDEDAPCFALRVMNTGARFWLMNSRIHGQRSLGKCSEMKASKARVEAEDKLLEIKNGKEVQRKAKDKPTLRTVLELFWRTQNSSKKYQKGMTDTFTIYGAEILDVPMEDIDTNLAMATLEAAYKKSLRQGDLLKQYANRMYKHAKMESPFAGIKNRWTAVAPPFAIPVERMPDLLDAIEVASRIGTRDVLWTVLLTGFRPEAVVCMRWEFLRLDEADAAYFISPGAPGFKDGESWWYPLPEFLAKRLRKRKQHFEYGPWVFHSPLDSDKHITNFRDAVLGLRVNAGIPELQPYHFRDTRATYCERFFGQTIVTQRLLNHRPDYVPDTWVVDARLVKASQSTHRYIKTHAHEIRGYVERYCDIILELGNQKPMTDIVKEVFIENKAMALAERFAPQALPAQ